MYFANVNVAATYFTAVNKKQSSGLSLVVNGLCPQTCLTKAAV